MVSKSLRSALCPAECRELAVCPSPQAICYSNQMTKAHTEEGKRKKVLMKPVVMQRKVSFSWEP